MSTRIVKIRGREYDQEVEYLWDPVKKVGKTKVLRHLGPLKPLNPERYVLVKLNISAANTRVKKIWKKGNQSIGNQKNSAEQNKTDLPPLTPPPDLIVKVLNSVKASDKRLSGNEAYNLLSQSSQIKPDEPQTLKTHIGFALTILEREGKISRTGKGKIGDLISTHQDSRWKAVSLAPLNKLEHVQLC